LRLDEEVLDAAPEVEEHSGDRRTDALKQEKTRAWVDVGVRLAFKGKAERNNKHHSNGDQFERTSHSFGFPWEDAPRRGAISLEVKTLSASKSFGAMNIFTLQRLKSFLACFSSSEHLKRSYFVACSKGNISTPSRVTNLGVYHIGILPILLPHGVSLARFPTRRLSPGSAPC
jgi:hypothetical protein